MTVLKSTLRTKLPAKPAWYAAYCFLFFLLMTVCQFYVRGNVYLDDDAYYYVVTAKNVLTSHISSFDGQTLTNGYQPLWLVLLLAQYSIFGGSVYVTITLQLLLITAALYLLLSALNTTDTISYAIFSIIFVRLMMHLVGDGGMEIPLWAACFAGTVYVAKVLDLRRTRETLVLGLLVTLCIGARIDSAVFVMPLLYLILPTMKQRIQAFSVVGICGIIYATWNDRTFGLPFPISGAIKSLGGFQVNHTLIAQLLNSNVTDAAIHPLALLSSTSWQMAMLWISCTILIFVAPRGSFVQRLLLAYAIGLVAYAVKLVLFSSWRIWEWYNYPVIIGATATLYVILPLLSAYVERVNAWIRRGALIMLSVIFVTAPVAFCLSSASKQDHDDYTAISQLAIAKFSPALKGQRVAMGDRAGSFAFLYGGPVTQLEGLVNDKEYYELISAGGDIKPLLCRRGVRYFVSFSVDLGPSYVNHDVKIFRSSLTQFPGPTLRVSVHQEVGKVFDLDKFDNRSSDEGDNYLYIWDLSCPPGGDQG